jgi:hypothetical protein
LPFFVGAVIHAACDVEAQRAKRSVQTAWDIASRYKRQRRKAYLIGISIANRETVSSLLGLAAIEGIEREQDLIGLAPKDCFITAEPIEGEIGQIRYTQKALGELNSGTSRFHRESGHRFQIIFAVGRNVMCVVAVRPRPVEHGVENVARMRQQFTGMPVAAQMLA